MDFKHQQAAHCESGVISSLMRHHGAPMSESMALGLSSALSFAYLPFIKLSGLPLISYRMPPKAIIKGLLAPMAARFRFETFGSAEAGQRRLDALLADGKLVGLQTSVYWLPYFPPNMRFHFNAHNLLVYGKDGDDYLISDPVFEEPVRCPSGDLARARFAKGVLAPKGLMYYPQAIERKAVDAASVVKAIRKTVRTMLAPIPIVGVRGMRTLAARMQKLSPADPRSVGLHRPRGAHAGRNRHRRGGLPLHLRGLLAGGGAAARQAAAAADVGAAHRHRRRLARLRAEGARMVKGREAVDPVALAAKLREQAEQEESFFRDLKAAVA